MVSKPTVLVVGGAGYVGSHTVLAFAELAETYNVVVADNLETGNRGAVPDGVEFRALDMADRPAVAALLEEFRPAAIVDFVAYLAVEESQNEPEKYLRNNVANFKNLLTAAASAGCCKAFVKSSTQATFGDIREDESPVPESFNAGPVAKFAGAPQMLEGSWGGAPVTGRELFERAMGAYAADIAPAAAGVEGDIDLTLTDEEKERLNTPCSIYGWSKLLNEIMMAKVERSHGMKWIALRYGNVTGADPKCRIGEAKRKPHTLMTLCIYSIMGNLGTMPMDKPGVRKQLKVFGTDYPTRDGTCIRDYVHPTDLASAHVEAVKQLLAGRERCEAYNLGTQTGSTVFEVIRAVEKASGHKLDYVTTDRRPGDAAQSILDCTKARAELGYDMQYDLEAMADTAWKWHTSHPDGFDG